MTFEYRIESLNRALALNELGDQGWELVAVADFTCYFKRAKPITIGRPDFETKGVDQTSHI